MKIKALKAILFAAMPIVAGTAFAATINSNYLIGKVDPGSPASPTNELGRLQFLVTSYNGGSIAGNVTNPSDLGHAYTLTLGSNVPAAPLLSPVVTASSQLAGGFTSANIDFGTGFEYLLVKWANIDTFYYIGGLTGFNTVTNDVVFNPNQRPQDASHYVFYNQTTPGTGGTPGVPDGGTTLALLGGSLLGLGSLRRLMLKKS